MRYYIKNNQIKPQSQIIVEIDNKQIINPTVEQIIADGWVEYQAPVVEAQEISAEERRRQAYQVECDQYLIAYHGYILEGELEKAEEQKQLYLQKKNEIRDNLQ